VAPSIEFDDMKKVGNEIIGKKLLVFSILMHPQILIQYCVCIDIVRLVYVQSLS
jgi:hypothetical protein